MWRRCDICGAPDSYALEIATKEGGAVAIFHVCETCATEVASNKSPDMNFHMIKKTIKAEGVFDFSIK